jgi:hypothetical protein
MRSQRIMIALTVANGALLATMLLGAAPTNPSDKLAPSVVRAQALELVDGDGNVRAQLCLTDSGGALLRMRDGRGEVRVQLEAKNDGSGLLLINGNTEPAVQLGADKNGTQITLTGVDKKKKTIAP